MIRLDEADLRIIFGDDFYAHDTAGKVRADLDRAATSLVALGNDLASPAGWSGGGLELSLLRSGQNSLDGFVDPFPVSFYVEMRPPGYYGDDDLDDPGWDVEATISIRCGAPTDCGMHLIETVSDISTSSPAEAAQALVQAVETLCKRARQVPLEGWRDLDPGCGHG